MFHLALPGDAVGKSNFGKRKRKEKNKSREWRKRREGLEVFGLFTRWLRLSTYLFGGSSQPIGLLE